MLHAIDRPKKRIKRVSPSSGKRKNGNFPFHPDLKHSENYHLIIANQGEIYYSEDMSRKKRRATFISVRFSIFIVIAIIIGAWFFYSFSQKTFAAASFMIGTITPQNEIRRGGELAFMGSSLNQKRGEELVVGVEYEGLKLELVSVEAANIGKVSWKEADPNGDKKRIVVSGVATTDAVGATSTPFARVNFRIIDQISPQGEGFTEVCALFDVIEGETNTPTPTTFQQSPQQPPQQSPSPPDSQPPTPVSNLDRTLACIPLNVHGSPSDKLDILIIASGYQDFELFLSHAVRAVSEFENTNLIKYRREILDKINWYVYNHQKIDGHPLSKEEVDFIAMESTTCPKDRFLILEDASDKISGISKFGVGGIVRSGSFQSQNFIVSAHEWGHYVGFLADEYLSNTLGLGNCTTEPSDADPRNDPCPEQEPYQCSNKDALEYKAPCPAWDCSKIDCTPLMKTLYQGSGCYPRCGVPNAYRPQAQSPMDRSMFFPGRTVETYQFNGPSLYSIINALSRYQ